MATTAFIIIVCVQALLLAKAVNGDCGANCTKKLCTNCCWCSQMNYANYQSCGCCSSGACCSNGTASGFACCPSGSTCQSGQCVKIVPASPVNADMTCSTCSNASATVNLTITVSTNLTALYVDGVQVPFSSLPNAAVVGALDVVQIPATSCVVAVSGDAGGATGGILADIAAYGVATDGTWKCTGYTDTPPTNWSSPSFDDASWDNGTQPQSGPTVPTDYTGSAVFIWAPAGADSTTPTTVVCRKRLPTCATNACGVSIPGCDNPCLKAGKECCNCQTVPQGPQLVCSCCPKGYSCTGALTATGQPLCCPRGSTYVYDTSLNKAVCKNVPAVPQPVQKLCGLCK